MFHFNLFYVLQNQNKQIFKELKQNIKDHSKRWYICKNEKPKIYLKVLIRVQNNKYIKTKAYLNGFGSSAVTATRRRRSQPHKTDQTALIHLITFIYKLILAT
jgi:hypothetical protein